MSNKPNYEEVKNNAPLSDAELEGVAGGQSAMMGNEDHTTAGAILIVTGNTDAKNGAANQTGAVSTMGTNAIMGVTTPDETNKRAKPDIKNH